ncbi:MAG TPA: MFS transporter [Rhizomicrobium sp.]|nr:MFS transporter [Rhizomicrobium sp.]
MQALRGWTPVQKRTVAASYLAWTLDAFDYFLLVFVLRDVAAQFATTITTIAFATTLTLAMRPLGAFIFGRLADRFGRRPVLMVNIGVYSLLSFATAFSPSVTGLLVIRALFGVGMGGIWGVASSLAMERINKEARGAVSGLLQSGYSAGYLLAALVYGILFPLVGWRGMFMVGILPAVILIPFILAAVPESPSFVKEEKKPSTFQVLRDHAGLALYAILLMTAFNFFSHGTQDIYPTFLQRQHGLPPATVSSITILGNIGAILGCFLFGSLSQHFGRRRMMITSALLSILVIYVWAFSEGLALLMLGAFLMQFFNQGAWSIIPAHLNELSPRAARGTFPGTVYQLGNLFASVNLPLQTSIAEQQHSYSIAMAAVAFCAAVAISLLLAFGPEAHNTEL